jgi:hypothetical protein
MRSFFDSLRSDLLDRRFLPVLAVLGVALVAALAFAVLGGGSSTSSTPPATSATTGASGPVGAVAITPAPAANQAVAETTSGSHQHSGAPRNPFTPLPSSQAKSATTSTPSKSSASSSSSGSSSSGSSSSSTSTGQSTSKTETTPKPIAPPKRVYIHYHVTAEFGLVPPAVAGAPAQLKTYPNMALDEPLPSKDNPQLLFLGVVLRTGKDAVFALTGAAILHGNAVCKPSPTQCQAIQLPIGQSETLEVVEANGQSATYELKLVSISKSVSKASAATAHKASATTSQAGRRLLGRDGVPTLSELHYASWHGGLVFIGHRAFAAHAASRRR